MRALDQGVALRRAVDPRGAHHPRVRRRQLSQRRWCGRTRLF